MTKNEFLFELRKKLKRMPQAETENAISYYEEYFADAGVENEQKVISELGSPASVASKIIGEYAIDDAEKSKRKGIGPLWIVIFAICASPIAFPIAFAVAIVAISLIFSLFVVFLSFGISGAAVVISGIASVVAGVVAMFGNFPTGLFYIGYGLISISLSTIIIILIASLAKNIFLGLQKLLAKFLIRRGSN